MKNPRVSGRKEILKIRAEINAWDDFYFFEFTKASFMAQDVIYPGEGSMCA